MTINLTDPQAPVTDEELDQLETLPSGYLQGHQDGLEWAAQMTEANHPQTGDWLYDDPIALAAAIRKGPDMPLASGNYPVTPDSWIPVSERMPEVGDNDYRTPLPVLVNCEMGAIPAYYGFVWHKGEKCFGFMESLRYGNGDGSGPDELESGLMANVTHWQPLPAPKEIV